MITLSLYQGLHYKEDFPHIYTVRVCWTMVGATLDPIFVQGRAANDGAAAQAVSYLSCKREITGKDKRACLYYHIGRCVGPCIGAVSREEYRGLIEQVVLFLEGKQERIVIDLQRKMELAAQELKFERAATLRDQIYALQQVVEKQKIVSNARNDQDVVAFAREDGQVCVQTFFIRGVS